MKIQMQNLFICRKLETTVFGLKKRWQLLPNKILSLMTVRDILWSKPSKKIILEFLNGFEKKGLLFFSVYAVTVAEF